MTIPTERPLLYGHRGASAEFPENTVESFGRALACGVDVVESDIHLTRDGEIVMAHDDTGLRMTNNPETLSSTDFTDIRKWDAGFGFVAPDGARPFAGKGLEVPRLLDVLLKWPTARFNLDIKVHDVKILDPLLDVLRRGKAMERITLASFHFPLLLEVRRRGFAGTIALGRRHIIGLRFAPRWFLRGGSFLPQNVRAQIPVSSRGIDLSRERFIAKCKTCGVPVDYWTINDVDLARDLLSRGAGGIMTDDPAEVAVAFSQYRR